MTTAPVPASIAERPDLADLWRAARAAQANAHAPYSNYPVGAAVRTTDGSVFAGCNVENAAYPQGWCAETSALAAMVTSGHRDIVAVLTVSGRAGEIGTCCGGCRQKVREFAALDTPIYACEPNGTFVTYTVASLLPDSFGPEHLR